jgi:MFS family permease
MGTAHPASEPSQSRFNYGWVVVGASSLVMLVAFGMHSSFGLFLDPLRAEFGWSRAAISGAYSFSQILAGMLGLLAGLATDRLGPRIVVTVCGLFFGAGAVLTSRVETVWQLYVFFGLLVGAGISGMWVPLLSTVARWFSGRRSLATGIALSGMTLGQVVAPLIIGRLIAAYGWRTSVLVFGIAAMVVMVAGAQLLKRDPGSVARAVEAAAAREAAIGDPAGAGADGDPNSHLSGLTFGEALRTRRFWMMSAVFFFVGIGAFGVLIHLAPRAISLGMSEVDAANILAVAGAVGVAGSFLLGGLLGGRIGDRRAFIVGLVLTITALLLLVPAHRLWALYGCAVIFGLGMSGMGTSESPLVAELFGLRNHASIYSAAGVGYTAGAALGPLLFGLIFDATGTYDPALFMGVGFGVVGLVLLIALGR